MSGKIISMRHVSFGYHNENKELNNINLDIEEGTCVLITGASGCGKTTLSRLINGLIPNYYEGNLSGSIIINGKTTTEMQSWEFGLYASSVFQDTRSQFFTSTVIDEAAFAAENYGKDSAWICNRITSVFKENDINHLTLQKLSTLSSGEKQKTAMAVAQINNPDIYVLDEPSANLDYDSAWILSETIKKLKALGKTIIIADHRFHFLTDVIDRVVYLDQGSIKQIWSSRTFLSLSKKELMSLGLRDWKNGLTEKQVDPTEKIKKQHYDLELLNVDVGFSRLTPPIIKDLSAQFSKGEIVAITGNNGVGKTTFAKTVCGLKKEKSGEIRFKGIKTSAKKRLSKTWFVLQDADYQLFSDSVFNELLLGMKPDSVLNKRAGELLKKLGLWEYKSQHPATLSGGQKQRLTFAVGLMRQPEILILDEPTSGLDALNMTKIADLIKEEASTGTIVIVISHDYEFIENTCTRVIHIER